MISLGQRQQNFQRKKHLMNCLFFRIILYHFNCLRAFCVVLNILSIFTLTIFRIIKYYSSPFEKNMLLIAMYETSFTHSMKFWILLIFRTPSILCSVFLFYMICSFLSNTLSIPSQSCCHWQYLPLVFSVLQSIFQLHWTIHV